MRLEFGVGESLQSAQKIERLLDPLLHDGVAFSSHAFKAQVDELERVLQLP
jgi:hypothetical protein